MALSEFLRRSSAYRTRFSGHIYEFETGEVIDDLPVFQFAQSDATYRGFEIEGQITLVEGPVAVVLEGLVDAVEATIDDFGAAPRIPPLRFSAGIEARSERWGGRIEAERTTQQTRTTGFEMSTPGFTLVNLSLDWKPKDDRDLRFTIAAANVFDVEARRHASFLKDYAPLAGRDIRLGLSAGF